MREHWRVLNERESRTYFSEDSRVLAPEPAALAIESEGLVVGAADVLAREAARYHVSKAPPRAPVEGAYIVPNGKRWKEPVVLPL